MVARFNLWDLKNKKMKKKMLLFLMLSTAAASVVASDLNPEAKGVWANATSELVQTDSVLIYFTRNDKLDTKSATLIIPSRKVDRTTVFTPDTILIQKGEPLRIESNDGSIVVNGEPMYFVEDIKTVKPYRQLEANAVNIAECLQQWQLGTMVMLDADGLSCQVMINTNNNSFMYMISPQMTYIRAASLRHTDKGSVFLQNIRMMRNMNTGEYTHYSAPDNYKLLKKLPDIHPAKFVPNTCTFADEGIYWSFVSCEPKRIVLNGCGEEYIYSPTAEDSGIIEWFEFVPQPKWLSALF